MLYWVAMLANVVMLIFFGWALTMHGLPDLVSQRIGILLLFVAPALNIAALFGAREDTLFGLWIRAKKQKFRRELDRGKNSPR